MLSQRAPKPLCSYCSEQYTYTFVLISKSATEHLDSQGCAWWLHIAQTAQEWGWAIILECNGNYCTAPFQSAGTALAAQGLRGRTFPHILLVLLLLTVNLLRQPQLRAKNEGHVTYSPVQDRDIALAKFALFTHCRIAWCSPLARTKLHNAITPQNREQASSREAVLIYFQSKPYTAEDLLQPWPVQNSSYKQKLCCETNCTEQYK